MSFNMSTQETTQGKSCDAVRCTKQQLIATGHLPKTGKWALLVAILFFVTGWQVLMAQTVIDQATDYNVIPKNPQAAELGSYANVAINGATGTPDITIPIYTLNEDGVSVPISLSYNATGIRAEDIATEAGLKWSLIAGGSVSRTIKGLPDDDGSGWFYYSGANFPDLSWNENVPCYQNTDTYFDAVSDNTVDVIPDAYSYDFAGYHGNFFFDRSKNLYKAVADDIGITSSWGTYFFNNFVLVDKMGIRYEFGGTGYDSGTTIVTNTSRGVVNGARSSDGITEWKLKQIITKNGNTIDFTYSDYTIEYDLYDQVIKNSNDQAPVGWDGLTTHSSSYEINVKLFNKIETDQVSVDFIYETDASASVWQKKLTEIKITDKIKNASKSYLFEYDRYSSNNKLRLRRLKEKGTSGTTGDKVWEFNYDSNTVPAMDTKDVDFFGYYNGAGNSGYVPVNIDRYDLSIDTLNNRNVNPSTIANGILNEVVYPTGGKTHFYYEANQGISTLGKTIYAPGVRVYKTEDVDTDNTKYRVKEYEYSGLAGNLRERNDYTFYQRSFTSSEYNDYMFYSHPVNENYPVSGYCYQNVEINYYEGTTLKYHEEETYSPNEMNYTIYPRLINKKQYNSSGNLLHREGYSYSGGDFQTRIQGWKIESAYYVGLYYSACDGVYNLPGIYYSGIYMDYRNDSYSALLLNTKETTDYFGSDSLFVYNGYTYNSDLQITQESKYRDATDQVYYRNYTYPSASVYTTLYNKHMIGLPLTVTDVKRDIIVFPRTYTDYTYNKQKFEYDSNGNISQRYGFINNPTVDYVQLEEEYSYVSGTGKLQQVKKKGNRYTTYLWSYNKALPVAKVEGASATDVGSVISISTLENYTSDSSIQSTLTTLRNGIGANKLVSGYLYDPIYGVKQLIDNNGYSGYFNYDQYGRLEYMLNDDTHVTNKFIYNYGAN